MSLLSLWSNLMHPFSRVAFYTKIFVRERLTVLWSCLRRLELHAVCVFVFCSRATGRWGLCWCSEGPLMCEIANCCSDKPLPAGGPQRVSHYVYSIDANHLKEMVKQSNINMLVYSLHSILCLIIIVLETKITILFSHELITYMQARYIWKKYGCFCFFFKPILCKNMNSLNKWRMKTEIIASVSISHGEIEGQVKYTALWDTLCALVIFAHFG